MIAIVGANGKTGRELVKQSLQKGLPVIPIVKDDKDADQLEAWVGVNDLRCANADHIQALHAALSDATAVISCIDSRTAGYGAPRYGRYAAGNVVNVAADLGIHKILHLSVMGAYRWSPNPLNRASFHHDRWIRKSSAPWTMLRISCYHDEVIDAHCTPPDGGKPHRVHPSSRYSPVSRSDAAKAALRLIPKLIPNRTLLCGGPNTFNGHQLESLIAPYRKHSRKKTHFGPLPHGDFSVPSATSQIMLGWQPKESLQGALDLRSDILTNRKPFWNRKITHKHPLDKEVNNGVLELIEPGLRYALHDQIRQDALALALTNPKFIDFSQAKSIGTGTPIYQSQLYKQKGVFLIDEENTSHGPFVIEHLYDELADDLHIWISTKDGLPERIWNRLDLGIRRRLCNHPRFAKDQKVLNFIASKHESINLR